MVIHVSESNLINRVVFEGNSKVKTETLTSEVRTRAHGSFNQTVIDQDIARLLEIYKRSGRAAAKITYRTVQLPNGRIDVVFTVEEGDKTGVKEIKFVGNNVYSTGRLVDLMETTEMNFLSFLKTSDVYDPDRIASDLELVRRFYLKNGYADFHVVSSDAVFDPAQGGYVITIVVEEGPQYRVSNVDIEFASARHRSRIAAARSAPLARRRLQWRRGGEDGRIADARDRQEGLRLLAGAAARRAQSRRSDGGHPLRRRRGSARLYRAHQYSRQHAHARLCDSPRVRDRRGRRL